MGKQVNTNDSFDESRIIVGLDIGTSKVTAIIGLLPIHSNHEIKIIAVGNSISHGMQKGVVTNIDYTVNAIEKAISEAESFTKKSIKSVYVNLSGSDIYSENSRGMVTLKGKEVSQIDIDNVIAAAKAINLPADRKLLHILPQSYSLDKQKGIKDPMGMSGMRLEVSAHLISCKANALKNIQKCVKLCGLVIEEIISDPLAASYSILTDDEKELGVCLIDIGAGTAGIIAMQSSQVIHTSIIPVAGNQVTNDIAVTLRTPVKHAEEIKIRYAHSLSAKVNQEEQIQVPNVGGRPNSSFPRHLLAQVCEERYAELFRIIDKKLHENKVHENIRGGGIVLTGGATNIEGLVELALSIFRLPIRLGTPNCYTDDKLKGIINTSSYAVSTGLLLHNKPNDTNAYTTNRKRVPFFGKLISWFKENF